MWRWRSRGCCVPLHAWAVRRDSHATAIATSGERSEEELLSGENDAERGIEPTTTNWGEEWYLDRGLRRLVHHQHDTGGKRCDGHEFEIPARALGEHLLAAAEHQRIYEQVIGVDQSGFL